ncbi:DJ-1/PfpI family protein [Saccharothrix yanglingensis]|uniref:Glutamine amidotransferase n=1 Tax=Saccharothrix yanglingensis TaxID=659496 RepID=A0ABU0X1B9_9PSEU|nr:DJ-1/PfpI family protein [Saccharothrix yanglingensis]MDQ2585931.1 glutamine amidotransferase [Saccharothrix yanglingensis]
MTTTIHLAVYDGLADWEFGHVAAGVNNPAFQRSPGRHRIRTVAAAPDPVTTIGGVRITPDLVLDDVAPAGSGMLVLPGGDSWEGGGNAPFAVAARRWLEAGVPVAAICGAVAGLAAEGLLDDRPHTGNAVEELSSAPGYGGAALFRPERAVRSGGLVTAGGASALEFAREVFAELDLYTPEVLEAWYGLHSTGDPAWSGRPVDA